MIIYFYMNDKDKIQGKFNIKRRFSNWKLSRDWRKNPKLPKLIRDQIYEIVNDIFIEENLRVILSGKERLSYRAS